MKLHVRHHAGLVTPFRSLCLHFGRRRLEFCWTGFRWRVVAGRQYDIRWLATDQSVLVLGLYINLKTLDYMDTPCWDYVGWRVGS